MKELTVREVQDAAGARNRWLDPAQKLDMVFRGTELGGEVGELLNVLKKIYLLGLGLPGPTKTREEYVRDARDEIGASLVCLALVANACDVDLAEAVSQKFNKTSAKIGASHRLGGIAVGDLVLVCGHDVHGDAELEGQIRRVSAVAHGLCSLEGEAEAFPEASLTYIPVVPRATGGAAARKPCVPPALDNLPYRTVSTVLAALRYFQANAEDEVIRSMDHFVDVDPLGSAEIDELCSRLNGESQVGGVDGANELTRLLLACAEVNDVDVDHMHLLLHEAQIETWDTTTPMSGAVQLLADKLGAVQANVLLGHSHVILSWYKEIEQAGYSLADAVQDFIDNKCDAAVSPLGRLGKTSRGFGIIEFKDTNGRACSVQESSLATESRVWLGLDGANPQIMAAHAAAHGVKTDRTEGWVPYPIPDAVSLDTQMHLNREQVAALIPVLQAWLADGELK
jgi:NTP pyrophosphatase (non-canonical NTP hydrolase)